MSSLNPFTAALRTSPQFLGHPRSVGTLVGPGVGDGDGGGEGACVGRREMVGVGEGMGDGRGDGAGVGTGEGRGEGAGVGLGVGSSEMVGMGEGMGDGTGVGVHVVASAQQRAKCVLFSPWLVECCCCCVGGLGWVRTRKRGRVNQRERGGNMVGKGREVFEKLHFNSFTFGPVALLTHCRVAELPLPPKLVAPNATR